MLFQHQQEGVAFLKKKKKAILADEMGLGKTRQAIVAARESSPGAVLVVCPASLKINWQREINEMYPEENVMIVSGRKKPAFEFEPGEKAEWIVINYDVLAYHDWLAEEISVSIDTIIFDEAHYMKGKTTDRAKASVELAKNAERVYMLTGTPILNRPAEMFNMLKGIGHPLGKFRGVFVKKFCGGQEKVIVRDLWGGRTFFVMPGGQWGFKRPQYTWYKFVDDTGATHLDELQRTTADVILRRMKRDVLDLPEKIISHVDVELSPEWKHEYLVAWDKYIEWIELNPDGEKDLKNIKSAQQLIEVGKLKQVCSLAKIERIVADIENAIESDQKVVVFTQYTATIEALRANLHEKKIDTVELTGKTKIEERQSVVDEFQTKDNIKVFLANIKAGGVGITLTAASLVMFADMDWSPEVNAQAEDRAHRIGQNGTVNVYYYITKDTVEEQIVEILLEKKDIIRGILGAESYQQDDIV